MHQLWIEFFVFTFMWYQSENKSTLSSRKEHQTRMIGIACTVVFIPSVSMVLLASPSTQLSDGGN